MTFTPFLSTSLEVFTQTFSTEEKCLSYLHNLKWGKGFKCRKCGCSRAIKGSTPYHKRCGNCAYNESPTAYTEFKHRKMPLKKAFAMAFRVILCKKGASSLALASDFLVNPKTAWAFRRKIQNSIQFYLKLKEPECSQMIFRPMDSTIISHRGKERNGFQQSAVFLRLLPQGDLGLKKSGKSCKPASTQIKVESDLLNGKYVAEQKDLMLWHLKMWLSGTHHHCSPKYFEGYLSEFLFRLNHRFNRRLLWHNLICLLCCVSYAAY